MVIGAGPAGVAAAVKAREVGLNHLVVERGSSIFKGMRDVYPEGKGVYPTVPKGEVRSFEVDFLKPPEEKVPLREYIERVEKALENLGGLNINFEEKFRGFEKEKGMLRVKTSRGEYRARNLVLAIGSNIPRGLNIYGEAAPVARTLTMPEKYIGRHVLVIGGGNTGADVVRKLSKTKREAGDSTHIYWAHRRERFKVDREVARDLGEEILLGGEIKILQETMPTLGRRDERGTLMLNIKVSEYTTSEGERMYQGMSFPMEDVIACIGFRAPSKLFEKLELELMEGPDGKKETIILDVNLQTSVKGVYAIGGAISPAYIDPSLTK